MMDLVMSRGVRLIVEPARWDDLARELLAMVTSSRCGVDAALRGLEEEWSTTSIRRRPELWI